jgi:hypothetical protein
MAVYGKGGQSGLFVLKRQSDAQGDQNRAHASVEPWNKPRGMPQFDGQSFAKQ